MIVDHLSRAQMYERVTKHMHHAFAFLRRTDLTTLPKGRYEIAGDDAYALVQDYTTKPADLAKWESHRQYIDVQFVAAGVEGMGYGHIDQFAVTKGYDATGDYLLYSGSGDQFTMKPGLFAILWPHDVHRPTVAVGEPTPVRKIVIKVRVDQ